MLSTSTVFLDEQWVRDNGLATSTAFPALTTFGIPGVVTLQLGKSTTYSDAEGMKNAIHRRTTSLRGHFVRDDREQLAFQGDDGMVHPLLLMSGAREALSSLIDVRVDSWFAAFDKPGERVLRPVLVTGAPDDATIRCLSLKSILGVGDLLFPREGGFPIPVANAVTPRLVVVRGAAGTGKTTLAVQLMVAMARQNVRCEYLCTNESVDSVVHTAATYGFCNLEEIARWQQDHYPVVTIKNVLATLEDVKGDDFVRKVFPGRFSHRYDERQYTTSALFIDSLDPYRFPELGAAALGNLRRRLSEFKKRQALTFIFLEELGDASSVEAQRHTSDCENMADILVELKVETESGYQFNKIRVKKRHFGSHVLGWHEYKLLPAEHSLSNIDEVKGFAVLPSLHYYLSRSRNDTYSRKGNFVHTGIGHLDSLLTPRHAGHELDGRTIPRNSCIVVQGRNTWYDAPVATNLLLGGLWAPCGKDKSERGGDVLIISLREETNIDLGLEAMAYRTAMFAEKPSAVQLDNGRCFRWRRHDQTLGRDAFLRLLERFDVRNATSETLWDALHAHEMLDSIGQVSSTFMRLDLPTAIATLQGSGLPLPTTRQDTFLNAVYAMLVSTYRGEEHYYTDEEHHPKCAHSALFQPGKNDHKKVVFNKWCAHLCDSKGERTGKCAKVVIATFRPGCISPEEFLRPIELLLRPTRGSHDSPFSRVMFISTALMANRFPLLASSELFIPALVDLLKSRNLVSIFVDPQLQEQPSQTSLGLRSLADYLIEIKNSDDMEPKLSPPPHCPDELVPTAEIQTNPDGCPWSQVFVHNVRGKNYLRAAHGATVRPLEAPPFAYAQSSLTDELARAGATLVSTERERLLASLTELGFVAAGDVTTDQCYMTFKDFKAIVGRELALPSTGIRTTHLDQVYADVWAVLTRRRPSRGNELHLVDLLPPRPSPAGTLCGPGPEMGRRTSDGETLLT